MSKTNWIYERRTTMEITELKEKIISASQCYYSGTPKISDDEFDALIDELRIISPEDDLLQTVSTGYSSELDRSGEKAKHKYLTVGSLNKVNSTNCEKYFEKKPGQYVITSKIDGGSIVCYYGDTGKFEKAITRGDGTTGIDCTAKMRYIVPKNIGLYNVAIRGEIIMTKEMFNLFYPDAASPRNTAMGLLSKDNPTPEELLRLSFVTYNIYGPAGDKEIPPYHKKSKVMQDLYENGFTIAQYTKLFDRNPRFLESLKGKLSPEFPADGLVITNELNRFEEIAYKFVAETAETTVTRIEWETSRLGNIIPVVYFNPVKLSGATLQKCSGFNAKWISDNKVGKGSRIIVHRAGEVIPYIKEVLTETLSSEQENWPNSCPDCQTRLEWKGVNLYCPNKDCSKKVLSKILLWIETLAQVDNLGENILIPFIDSMEWTAVSDIYNEPIESWEAKLVYGNLTKHAQDLLWELHKKLYSNPVDPGKFFAAFGLPSVGLSTSKRIAEEIEIDLYFEYGPDTAMNLDRITRPALKSLYENFSYMKEIYQQIKSAQGFIKKEKSNAIKVAVTGKLSKPRKDLVAEFATHVIEVVDSVSKGVAYLITDNPNSGSSKNTSAQKLGVQVISETEFREIMGL
jgi:DNA ligase (NAD+)